jgi:hypothetical protein
MVYSKEMVIVCFGGRSPLLLIIPLLNKYSVFAFYILAPGSRYPKEVGGFIFSFIPYQPQPSRRFLRYINRLKWAILPHSSARLVLLQAIGKLAAGDVQKADGEAVIFVAA